MSKAVQFTFKKYIWNAEGDTLSLYSQVDELKSVFKDLIVSVHCKIKGLLNLSWTMNPSAFITKGAKLAACCYQHLKRGDTLLTIRRCGDSNLLPILLEIPVVLFAQCIITECIIKGTTILQNNRARYHAVWPASQKALQPGQLLGNRCWMRENRGRQVSQY